MREKSSSTKGFMILSLAGIIAKVLSAFYVPLLTRIIGTDGVGIYSRSYEVFMFVYALTSMGCQPAVAKIVAEIRALGNEKDAIKALKVSRKIYGIVGLVLSILVIVIAGPLTNLIKISNAKFAIMFLAPSIVLTAILSSYRGYFQGRREMTQIAISQISEQLFRVVLGITLAYFLMYKWGANPGPEQGAAGAIMGATIGAIASIIYLIIAYLPAYLAYLIVTVR